MSCFNMKQENRNISTTEQKLRNAYSFQTIFPLLFSRILRGFISNKPNNSYLSLCFWYKVTAIPQVTCSRAWGGVESRPTTEVESSHGQVYPTSSRVIFSAHYMPHAYYWINCETNISQSVYSFSFFLSFLRTIVSIM